jgi:hypothetical protein
VQTVVRKFSIWVRIYLFLETVNKFIIIIIIIIIIISSSSSSSSIGKNLLLKYRLWIRKFAAYNIKVSCVSMFVTIDIWPLSTGSHSFLAHLLHSISPQTGSYICWCSLKNVTLKLHIYTKTCYHPEFQDPISNGTSVARSSISCARHVVVYHWGKIKRTNLGWPK